MYERKYLGYISPWFQPLDQCTQLYVRPQKNCLIESKVGRTIVKLKTELRTRNPISKCDVLFPLRAQIYKFLQTFEVIMANLLLFL